MPTGNSASRARPILPRSRRPAYSSPSSTTTTSCIHRRSRRSPTRPAVIPTSTCSTRTRTRSSRATRTASRSSSRTGRPSTSTRSCICSTASPSARRSSGGSVACAAGSTARRTTIWRLRASRIARRIHHVPRVLYHWRKIPGSAAAVVDAKPAALLAGRDALQEHARVAGPRGDRRGGPPAGHVPFAPLARAAAGDPGRAHRRPGDDARGKGEVRLLPNFLTSLARADHVSGRAASRGGRRRAVPRVDGGRRSGRRGQGDVLGLHAREAGVQLRAQGQLRGRAGRDRATSCCSTTTSKWSAPAGSRRCSSPSWTRRWQPSGATAPLPGRARPARRDRRRRQRRRSPRLLRAALGSTWDHGGSTHIIRNYSAVTAAVLATRRSTFTELGAFDEIFAHDFQDVDFCLRAVKTRVSDRLHAVRRAHPLRGDEPSRYGAGPGLRSPCFGSGGPTSWRTTRTTTRICTRDRTDYEP